MESLHLNDTAKTVLDNIYARRSIRRYTDAPVEEEKIDLLLQAAMAAPSACNLQPWEFIVVDDPATLARLKETTTMGAYNAPLAFVVCADTRAIPWTGEDWKIDCAAAVTNMMLLAQAMGLGSVWIGGYDDDALRALLDIPARTSVMNIVYFGYPASPRAPKTRYNPKAVYRNRYDPHRDRNLRTVEMLHDASTME